MSEMKIMTLGSQQHYDEKIKLHMTGEMQTHNNSDSAHEDIRNLINDKQDMITGSAGQFIVIGGDGKPTAMTIPRAEEATF